MLFRSRRTTPLTQLPPKSGRQLPGGDGRLHQRPRQPARAVRLHAEDREPRLQCVPPIPLRAACL